MFTRQGHSFFFFFNDTATTEIYTLSLHDALPISRYKITQETVWAESMQRTEWTVALAGSDFFTVLHLHGFGDRKSTRLNSSHGYISYAVFCLKKKKHSGRYCVTSPSAIVRVSVAC